MLYALVAFAAFFLGHYMRQLLSILLTIKNALQSLRMAQDVKVKEVPRVGFAEPKTAVELLAAQEAERIRELNQ